MNGRMVDELEEQLRRTDEEGGREKGKAGRGKRKASDYYCLLLDRGKKEGKGKKRGGADEQMGREKREKAEFAKRLVTCC